MTTRKPASPGIGLRISRRRALGGLGAAALTPVLPGCPTPDGAPDGGPGPLTAVEAIDTIVVVMMENRSFDHFMGSLSLVEGRSDVDGFTADMSNPLLDGTPVGPYLANRACAPDPPHGWSSCHDQWNGGANDGFVRRHEERHGPEIAPEVMTYWDRARLSAFYGLADAYTLCERWFCSVLGPTWPNRYFALLGTSHGVIENTFVSEETASFLEQAYRGGKSYGIYYGNVPSAVIAPRHSLEEPEMHVLEDFFTHAAEGTLPNVSWVEPLYGRNDDHPPAHPVAGQVFVQSIYEALAQSPQWDRCLLVVTYDEHGGFFDHVPPPTIEDDRVGEGFGQLGFRVPGLIVGPWVKEGYVSSTVLDHTSIHATLMALWGLEPRTTRDSASNHFLDAIDEDRLASGTPRPPVGLPAIEASDDELYADECVFDGGGFFSATTAGGGRIGSTGQPELELLARLRFGNHPRLRIAETDAIYERLLGVAEDLGVLRRRPGGRARRRG